MTDEQIIDLSREIIDSFINNDIIPKDYEYDIMVAREILFNKIHECLNNDKYNT